MKPQHYRKKPVVVEAVQFEDNDTSRTIIMQWLGEYDTPCEIKDGRLVIPTLEGNMTAEYGDYIIKGVQGEFYPCKPDIFKATYQDAKAGTLDGPKPPEQISRAKLDVLVMPNGEIICLGKTLGWVKDFHDRLTEVTVAV